MDQRFAFSSPDTGTRTTRQHTSEEDTQSADSDEGELQSDDQNKYRDVERWIIKKMRVDENGNCYKRLSGMATHTEVLSECKASYPQEHVSDEQIDENNNVKTHDAEENGHLLLTDDPGGAGGYGGSGKGPVTGAYETHSSEGLLLLSVPPTVTQSLQMMRRDSWDASSIGTSMSSTRHGTTWYPTHVRTLPSSTQASNSWYPGSVGTSPPSQTNIALCSPPGRTSDVVGDSPLKSDVLLPSETAYGISSPVALSSLRAGSSASLVGLTGVAVASSSSTQETATWCQDQVCTVSALPLDGAVDPHYSTASNFSACVGKAAASSDKSISCHRDHAAVTTSLQEPSSAVILPLEQSLTTASEKQHYASGKRQSSYVEDDPPPALHPVRTKRHYTQWQQIVLEAHFVDDRYCNPIRRDLLAKELGLTPDCVKAWFINRRRRRGQGRQKRNTTLQLHPAVASCSGNVHKQSTGCPVSEHSKLPEGQPVELQDLAEWRKATAGDPSKSECTATRGAAPDSLPHIPGLPASLPRRDVCSKTSTNVTASAGIPCTSTGYMTVPPLCMPQSFSSQAQPIYNPAFQQMFAPFRMPMPFPPAMHPGDYIRARLTDKICGASLPPRQPFFSRPSGVTYRTLPGVTPIFSPGVMPQLRPLDVRPCSLPSQVSSQFSPLGVIPPMWSSMTSYPQGSTEVTADTDQPSGGSRRNMSEPCQSSPIRTVSHIDCETLSPPVVNLYDNSPDQLPDSPPDVIRAEPPDSPDVTPVSQCPTDWSSMPCSSGLDTEATYSQQSSMSSSESVSKVRTSLPGINSFMQHRLPSFQHNENHQCAPAGVDSVLGETRSTSAGKVPPSDDDYNLVQPGAFSVIPQSSPQMLAHCSVSEASSGPTLNVPMDDDMTWPSKERFSPPSKPVYSGSGDFRTHSSIHGSEVLPLSESLSVHQEPVFALSPELHSSYGTAASPVDVTSPEPVDLSSPQSGAIISPQPRDVSSPQSHGVASPRAQDVASSQSPRQLEVMTSRPVSFVAPQPQHESSLPPQQTTSATVSESISAAERVIHYASTCASPTRETSTPLVLVYSRIPLSFEGLTRLLPPSHGHLQWRRVDLPNPDNLHQ